MLHFATSPFLAFACKLKRGGVIINGHTLTRRQTCRQLDVLGRWFDFIRLDQLPRRLSHPTGRPFCLLTFDDGKRSNFTEIAPELEARRVPAVFYVTTEPSSTGNLLWFDQRNQLAKQLGHCPAGLELDELKKLPFRRVMERLESACAHYDFTPDEQSDDLRPMSWDEVRDLGRRGFTIGAHGLTHAILTNETRETAFAEIEGSLAKVGSELGKPCATFAFPNGNYTSELAQHALRCGATTVMTTEPTWVDERYPSRRLPRIQLFGEFERARIELKLCLAALRGVLANPDGSGRQYLRPRKQNGTLRRKPNLQSI
ncbi:MAG: polysaccharide deacetylase family protein [Verrucomicrobiota bacterium]|nr:polysaccharide deacetylase family protein [Verrucomicrobiota bacterium]